MVDKVESSLEEKLRCQIIQFEGPEAIGARIFWNWQKCPYDKICYFQEEKEKHQPKPCSYNPKMFKCIAYQEFEMWKERDEEKKVIDEGHNLLRFLRGKKYIVPNLQGVYFFIGKKKL
jgi:hypothetical protein